MKENTDRASDGVRMARFVNREVSVAKAVVEAIAVVAMFILWIAACCA